MSKILEEIKALTWTLAGTGLVLICLDSTTLRLGLWITGIALVVHIVSTLLISEDE